MSARYRRCVDCDEFFHPDEMIPTRRTQPQIRVNRPSVTGDTRRLIRVPGREVHRFLCTRCAEDRKDEAAIAAVELAKTNLSGEKAA
jgi:hypothetical protein